MRIYLINPTKKWCKANLHCHSTHSDGSLTPEEIKKVYMEHGYQIIAYTDHEMIFDNSELTDDNFVAITSAEYSVYDKDTPANSTYVDKDAKEVSWRDVNTIHLCMFSKDPHNTMHFATSEENISPYMIDKYATYAHSKMKYDGYTRKFTPESIQETIDRANKAGFSKKGTINFSQKNLDIKHYNNSNKVVNIEP